MQELERKIAAIRRRLRLFRMLDRAFLGLIVGLCLAAVFLGVTRFFPLGPWEYPVAAGLVVAAVGVAALVAALRRISLFEAALRADVQLNLRERLSSALSLAELHRTGEAAYAALEADALQYARALQPARDFRYRAPRHARHAVWPALLCVALLFVPRYEVARTPPAPPTIRSTSTAMTPEERKKESEKIRELARQARKREEDLRVGEDLQFADKLERLAEDISMGRKDRKEALAEMSLMTDEMKLQQREAEKLTQPFRQIQGLKQADHTQDIQRDMKDQKFEAAAEKMQQLANELNNMSAEQKQEVASELQQLADQMKDNKQMADALQQAAQAVQQSAQQQPPPPPPTPTPAAQTAQQQPQEGQQGDQGQQQQGQQGQQQQASAGQQGQQGQQQQQQQQQQGQQQGQQGGQQQGGQQEQASAGQQQGQQGQQQANQQGSAGAQPQAGQQQSQQAAQQQAAAAMQQAAQQMQQMQQMAQQMQQLSELQGQLSQQMGSQQGGQSGPGGQQGQGQQPGPGQQGGQQMAQGGEMGQGGAGEQSGQGPGGKNNSQGDWSEGNTESEGMGSGGPGRGNGGAPPDDGSAATGFVDTFVPGQKNDGEIIAVFEVDAQVPKGESTIRYRNVPGELRQNAADAMRDTEIPVGYRNAVKDYFESIHFEAEKDK